MNMDAIQEIQKECDHYKHTVWGLLAFANHSTWDIEREEKYINSQYSLGRRMTTSEKKIVTPDLVVKRFTNYGLVCEAKKNLPKERGLWVKYIDQLSNYDNIIEGWFDSSTIKNYDVIFLTDISRSVDFGDYLENSDMAFKHNVATIGFEPTTETLDTFITLKKERGNISDSTLNESLRRVTKVPYSKIETTIGKVMFYDDEPPIVFTTRILWEHVCGARISPKTWNKKKKAHVFQLTLEEVTFELQEYYGQISKGERDVEIPRKKWIRKVLDFLANVGFAEKKDSHDNYTIFWKQIRGDILERFCKLWAEQEQRRRKRHAKQLQLFDD